MKIAISLLSATAFFGAIAFAQDPLINQLDVDQASQLTAQIAEQVQAEEPVISHFDRLDLDQISQLSTQITDQIHTDIHPMFLFDWKGLAAEDSMQQNYHAGTRAIDQHDYEAAITDMQRVIDAKSKRADAALYWKAYAQLKLGRSSDALGTLAELHRAYPKSSWLNDANALAMEARSRSGQTVSPETAGDEDLKLLALNGLMNSDPARATPLIEQVVADPKNAPQVRARALFVLARSSAPAAQQTVAKMAEGAANPDLQIRALQYLAATNSNSNSNGELFKQAYQHASDSDVKRAALNALFLSKDSSALLAIAKSESNPALQLEAMHFVGMTSGAASLMSLYQTASGDNLKRGIIDALASQGAAKELITIAEHEKNQQLKREAVERLSVMKNGDATSYLMDLLKK